MPQIFTKEEARKIVTDFENQTGTNSNEHVPFLVFVQRQVTSTVEAYGLDEFDEASKILRRTLKKPTIESGCHEQKILWVRQASPNEKSSRRTHPSAQRYIKQDITFGRCVGLCKDGCECERDLLTKKCKCVKKDVL